MEIKAADVAKLRKMTGAGMMDCKKALQEANGDYDRAQEIIREKGKLVASKRADRTATEGVVTGKVVGGKAYMVCLACETDFVAKNAEFAASANAILDIAIANDVADLDALMNVKAGNQTVADMVTEKSGQTGEKVELPFYARIEAPSCFCYVHMNNKLGTLVGFNMEVPAEVGKDVAMQAAAMAPVSISAADCPAEVIEKERQIGHEQARLEGKPEAMLDKIAEGKVNKFLKENTLLSQPTVKDNKVTVEQFIQKAVPGATVVAYKRFSLND
ncbi:MAG: elongation factor Ts [Rikenellaceae bacterium]|nr:elongation factor Ts [Rikenellaceae bacterium]